MAKTAVPNAPAEAATRARVPAARSQPSGLALWARKALRLLASLKLTVVLFVLALLLVLFGTLAMIDQGIWTVVNNYFRCWTVVWIPFQLLVQFGQVFFSDVFGVPLVSPTASLPGSFPFPGGWAIGTVMMVNLLAAHFVRFQKSWKRSGILLLHSGLVVLFAGEFVTGQFAVEGQMQIREGGSSNYVVHGRSSELAIIDSSDPNEDQVVVVPGWMLQKGGTISHLALPFDIEVRHFMVNSVLRRSAGDSAGVTALEQPEVSGTQSQDDTPSVYVTLRGKKDGSVLADNFLASYNLIPDRRPDDGKPYALARLPEMERLVPVPYQPVRVDRKEYDVSLRPKRSYKPYAIHLIDFRFDRYMGTSKPKNFSSEVRLIDPETKEDRTVVIRMNEPLMHRGEAFYQSSFDAATEEATVLQVVRDPGKPLPWLSLPYAGCLLVALGMLVHFGVSLVTFLQRRPAP